MREIMFRGKRLDNGKWIEGHLIRCENGRTRICESKTDIFCYEKECSIIQTVAHETETFTVGQYTGLQDENEKKIFHGDIGVLTVFDHNGYDYQYKVEAIFDDACGLCFNEVPLGGFWSYVSNDFDLGLQFEIIGNRWDNPELLEGGRE